MIYLDSSFVFSIQGRDVNTFAAVSLLQSANPPFLITRLCEVEVVNALSRRLFQKEISLKQAQASISDLESNLRKGVYSLASLPEGAFIRAKTLAQALTPVIGVRTADLLHVAAAIELGAQTLFTFDQRQHKTAQAVGLSVNPLP
jgi:predicted nucleic acid-binding protein